MGALRIGVVGLGVISRFYIEALTRVAGVRLAAVCDRDEAALHSFRGRVPCHLDYREMLDPGRLDAVVITLPNDAHAAACRAALGAGLAVCVEKPLALRLPEGEAILECAQANHVVNFTAFHRRYNSAIVALVRRLPAQPPIESLTVRYCERIEDHVGRDRWYLDPERCGGGCVADNGPNAYDLARLLLGELRVAAAAIERDAVGTDRQATVMLTAGGGVTARVELDWSYDGERKDVQIRFADGSSDSADMLAGYPGFKQSLWHEYVGVLEAFRDRLSSGDCCVDDGLAALALVEATYRDEASRRSPGRS